MVVKNIYRVIRSIFFTVLLFATALYIFIYILVSVPAFRTYIKEIAETELSALLGGDLKIERLDIFPFNELRVHDVTLSTPEGEKCVSIKSVGAGISLWKLLTEGRIEITYAEIIGLNGHVRKNTDGSLNITFLIDALKSKDEGKPPTKFDLQLRNVVLRQCSLSYDDENFETGTTAFDFHHIDLTDLKADVTFPRISNEETIVDLRRLAMVVNNKIDIVKLALKCRITPQSIELNDFLLKLPETLLTLGDISLEFNSFNEIIPILKERNHKIYLDNCYLTPSDLAGLYEPLVNFSDRISLSLEAEGNIDQISLLNFKLENGDNLGLSLTGDIQNVNDPSHLILDLNSFSFDISRNFKSRILELFEMKDSRVFSILNNLGSVSIEGDGKCDLSSGQIDGILNIHTDVGNIALNGGCQKNGNNFKDIKGEIAIEEFDLSEIFDRPLLEGINMSIDFEGDYTGKYPNGNVRAEIKDAIYRGNNLGGGIIEINKIDDDIDFKFDVDNETIALSLAAEGNIGSVENLSLTCDLIEIQPWRILDMKGFNGYNFKGILSLDGEGTGIHDYTGEMNLNDFSFYNPANGRSLDLEELQIKFNRNEKGREINLRSDWVDADISGDFRFDRMVAEVKGILHQCLPSLFPFAPSVLEDGQYLDFSVLIKENNSITEFFNLPFRFLVPISIYGSEIGNDDTIELDVDIPFIQQGKNKLIRDSRITAFADGKNGEFNVSVNSLMPVKNGEINLDLGIEGGDDLISTNIKFLNPSNPDFKGSLSLNAQIEKNELSHSPDIKMKISSSSISMGAEEWHIDESKISFLNKTLTVDNLRIWSDNQYVNVDGVASPSPSDSILVVLKDINVDYVFETLGIPYVTFGGTATGKVTGKGVLSSEPFAETSDFIIEDLSYNGTVIGDGDIYGQWNNDEKEVVIKADIFKNGKRRVKGGGGVWLTRDSLCFDILADKVPVKFIEPFVKVFSSDLGGFASGDVKLYGNFHDIDMTGKIFADSVSIKLDYTNTYYHGSDSVFLTPGKINIPSFRLFDKFGNSAMLTGELTHRYFHDPSFNFRLSDAKNFLCYDTNSSLNPDWYGMVYGSGGALITGLPGIVDIAIDMALVDNSTFTFVLNETMAAGDSHFLTFSDRRKEEQLRKEREKKDDIISMFRKKIEAENSIPSNFNIDVRATVGPNLLFTLVMDPRAGDKITARGSGALQVEYESSSDNLSMFGKYTIEEGNYNFSLQDLILRDFSIREGSSISFNGNPLMAELDMTAAYRVNTNLSDLDESFSTDRDLSRTNVPVDALLMVKGNAQSPDITFDIELPTLTQDVARKVRSIISTDDMMNRQIIYLLALNRFYTPEYMGSSSGGGELTAVASTTISSQLSNMLGQLTDKINVSPTFRSDRGDFSDLEVDVALSSKLLNNRLLVNGNFGYRDKSTSQTTFIGDFDIEYLLNKNGNLRLKAYNHFNDQNYYLREALTTQGLGVIYRRDFDNPFTFLKRHKKKKSSEDENKVENSEIKSIESSENK